MKNGKKVVHISRKFTRFKNWLAIQLLDRKNFKDDDKVSSWVHV